jgi:homoserine/homoserine lactone efflux protein
VEGFINGSFSFNGAMVMDSQTWWAYFVATWLIALSPGSGAVICVSHGLRYGVRRTSATIAGLQVGLAGITLIAGVGVGAVLVASATAFTVIKVLGAGYLIWLGWQQWRAPVHEGHGALDDAAHATPVHATNHQLSTRQRFLAGVFTNLTNPKGIVFMVAVLPQFIHPERALLPQLAILMTTMAVVDTLVMHGYAFTGARLAHLLRGARAQRVQNRVFGGVLMGMGASLLFVRRTA